MVIQFSQRPEAHSYLACSVIDEEAHVAGAVSVEKTGGRRQDRPHSGRLCKAWEDSGFDSERLPN